MAEIVRSGFVEGHHYGSVLALAADGSPAYVAGEVELQILPRSCNKPLQAYGMLRAGLRLEPQLLALACASHSGEDFQVDGVRRILADAGLDEDRLQTPPDYPLADPVRDKLLRAGGGPAPVLMNCSGKHAAMLASCVHNGWPTETYLDPVHPLQRAIAEAFSAMTGEPVAHIAVDGCGAPLLSTSLTGLARAFSRLARGLGGDDRPDEHAAQISRAIREFPEHVSGTSREESRLLRALPGAIGKAGAEGCYAVALADGRAFTLKVDDGAARARPVVMAALLERTGADRGHGVDTGAVRRTGRARLRGGGMDVGEIRAVLP